MPDDARAQEEQDESVEVVDVKPSRWELAERKEQRQRLERRQKESVEDLAEQWKVRKDTKRQEQREEVAQRLGKLKQQRERAAQVAQQRQQLHAAPSFADMRKSVENSSIGAAGRRAEPGSAAAAHGGEAGPPLLLPRGSRGKEFAGEEGVAGSSGAQSGGDAQRKAEEALGVAAGAGAAAASSSAKPAARRRNDDEVVVTGESEIIQNLQDSLREKMNFHKLFCELEEAKDRRVMLRLAAQQSSQEGALGDKGLNLMMSECEASPTITSQRLLARRLRRRQTRQVATEVLKCRRHVAVRTLPAATEAAVPQPRSQGFRRGSGGSSSARGGGSTSPRARFGAEPRVDVSGPRPGAAPPLELADWSFVPRLTELSARSAR
eukprot:TRINITY_DN33270_c0_g1_i1.p1 TRINITY_DN33270_c0_g1~~TRINITY_DN33270_c0_g1_i1.p1  ORF type:complete len:379 (+),score=93.92 TRINITY_DN33270_c0_g1_i1:136-1272(+)